MNSLPVRVISAPGSSWDDPVVIVAIVYAALTLGLFALAALDRPKRRAKLTDRRIRKLFQLSPGVTSLETVTFQHDEAEYQSHVLNLRAYNGAESALHNVCAYLTIDYQPDDRAWSLKGRLIDHAEPAQPVIRQPLWWISGSRCGLTTDIRPGETGEILFIRFRDQSSSTKSPEYIDEDLILRTITVGTTPENETPIIELQRRHRYKMYLTLVSDETQPMCFSLNVDPQNIFDSTTVEAVSKTVIEDYEHSIQQAWRKDAESRAKKHIRHQLGQDSEPHASSV
jgi:hypothetical protein